MIPLSTSIPSVLVAFLLVSIIADVNSASAASPLWSSSRAITFHRYLLVTLNITNTPSPPTSHYSTQLELTLSQAANILERSSYARYTIARPGLPRPSEHPTLHAYPPSHLAIDVTSADAASSVWCSDVVPKPPSLDAVLATVEQQLSVASTTPYYTGLIVAYPPGLAPAVECGRVGFVPYSRRRRRAGAAAARDGRLDPVFVLDSSKLSAERLAGFIAESVGLGAVLKHESSVSALSSSLQPVQVGRVLPAPHRVLFDLLPMSRVHVIDKAHTAGVLLVDIDVDPELAPPAHSYHALVYVPKSHPCTTIWLSRDDDSYQLHRTSCDVSAPVSTESHPLTATLTIEETPKMKLVLKPDSVSVSHADPHGGPICGASSDWQGDFNLLPAPPALPQSTEAPALTLLAGSSAALPITGIDQTVCESAEITLSPHLDVALPYRTLTCTPDVTYLVVSGGAVNEMPSAATKGSATITAKDGADPLVEIDITVNPGTFCDNGAVLDLGVQCPVWTRDGIPEDNHAPSLSASHVFCEVTPVWQPLHAECPLLGVPTLPTLAVELIGGVTSTPEPTLDEELLTIDGVNVSGSDAALRVTGNTTAASVVQDVPLAPFARLCVRSLGLDVDSPVMNTTAVSLELHFIASLVDTPYCAGLFSGKPFHIAIEAQDSAPEHWAIEAGSQALTFATNMTESSAIDDKQVINFSRAAGSSTSEMSRFAAVVTHPALPGVHASFSWQIGEPTIVDHATITASWPEPLDPSASFWVQVPVPVRWTSSAGCKCCRAEYFTVKTGAAPQHWAVEVADASSVLRLAPGSFHSRLFVEAQYKGKLAEPTSLELDVELVAYHPPTESTALHWQHGDFSFAEAVYSCPTRRFYPGQHAVHVKASFHDSATADQRPNSTSAGVVLLLVGILVVCGLIVMCMLSEQRRLCFRSRAPHHELVAMQSDDGL